MPEWETFEAFLAEVEQEDTARQRQDLVNVLLRQQTSWPWIQGNRATFVYSRMGTTRAALNLDTIKDDPPFVPMQQIEGTSLWHVTREFEPDDLLDYLLAIDDPMTPLAQETNLVARVQKHWIVDPLNPVQLKTAQMNVSVLRMPQARPFPDWAAMPGVPRGDVTDHLISSRQLGFTDRKLFVYTPPGYDTSREYPLLILMDALWCVGPLQVPAVADALIKHRRMRPAIIAMMQSPPQEERPRELIGNDRHVLFLLTELLPFVQSNYRVNALDLGIGGVDVGAVAAAHAALSGLEAFSRLLLISPPLLGQGKGAGEALLGTYRRRFETAPVLPRRIFQSVGRYEALARFLKPARQLADSLRSRGDVAYKLVEIGSGHSLVGFKSVIPEALAWTLPAEEAGA
jgi:enterochelin esterase family protein